VRGTSRPPLWRRPRARRLVVQAVFLAGVFAAYWWIGGNLVTNLRRLNFSTNFDFLGQRAGFAIPDSDFESSGSVGRAILVGARNTINVSAVGIALATIVGVLVGVARLSQNWLVRRAAGVYVETLRNVPVLVVIIFFYSAVVLQLPPLANAAEFFGGVIVSNGGIALPSLRSSGASTTFGWLVVAALVAAGVAWKWRARVFERTGARASRGRWSLGVFAAIVAVAYVGLGFPVEPSLPQREGPRIAGGIVLNTEYAALVIGLVAYTATHIAEIVRGSIQAVPNGQSEAAMALGLSNRQRLRLVVLPQAFRVMVPPLANQYLNLTKNSSLAIAIGYPELTRIVRIAMGQGSPAPQAIVVLMSIYLVFSLTISAATNVVNRRLQVTGR
jgi:general L-amino acid transport system permease protein